MCQTAGVPALVNIGLFFNKAFGFPDSFSSVQKAWCKFSLILQKLMFCRPLFFMEVENVPVADGVVACLNCCLTRLGAHNSCRKDFSVSLLI